MSHSLQVWSSMNRYATLSKDPQQIENWHQLRRRLHSAEPRERARMLDETARRTRRSVVRMIGAAGQGHIGGDFSVTDILTTLFAYALRIDPAEPTSTAARPLRPEQGPLRRRALLDARVRRLLPRCALSTLHAAALAAQRPPEPQQGARRRDQHRARSATACPSPSAQAIAAEIDRRRLPRLRRHRRRRAAGGQQLGGPDGGRHFKLDNLTAIVDRNRLQQGARTEDTNAPRPARRQARRLRLGGAGDRRPRLRPAARALRPSTTGRPVAVIANTIKGKGVSFMEDHVEWHHKVPSPEQVSPGTGGTRMSTDTQSRAPVDCARVRQPRRVRRRARRLARDDERIVAVCNDSVGLQQPRRLPRRVPRPAGQCRHRRAEHGRRRRRPRQRGPDPVRLRRLAVPHRPRARAGQGRRRLQPASTSCCAA